LSAIQAVILGLIQGLTEFLPVSSSGHLVMAQTVMGVPNPGIFLEVVLHVATLLSVVVVYRMRLWQLLRGVLVAERGAVGYVLLLILATVPAGLVGLFLGDAVETAFDTPAIAGVMLLVTGAILWSTRSLPPRIERPDSGPEQAPEAAPSPRFPVQPGVGLALGMGVAQAFAILPGISRSGTTIAAGMWGRLSAERAAEFSFLMSIPAIAGAAVLQAGDATATAGSLGAGVLAAGFLAALVSGIVAIRSLIWLLRRQQFHVFAYYVWAVGAGFLLYLILAR
jgi:undecaprenyl-diphosphatase